MAAIASSDGFPPSYDGFGFEALPEAREPMEFTHEIKARGGTPWATLTVQGDSRLTKTMPTVTQGSNLVGSVKLALRNVETIQAIRIMGDPLAPDNIGKSMLKLRGDYHWPFSIERRNLPPSSHFMDRLASFSVRYIAELRILRGKLRPDDKVMCPFGYFSMRQPWKLAYQENSPLFGPDADPEGWHTQSFSLKGMIFSSRMIEVKCAVRLCLSYTRSASIPCAMTIETEDIQALDLLSAPSSSIVFLERANHENVEVWKNTSELVGQAANLQPSSAVFGFAVEYSVVVFPFQAAAFKPMNNEPVLQQVVEITTRYAPGPRPKTYTAPTYNTRNVIVDQYYYMKVIQAAQLTRNRSQQMRVRGGRRG
ncbi:hypothetical protein C8R46DRAFT_1080132 [Mycena filopes]|nr:hypothetical protein C8R46DRAFT_1080132 [Mycena filopes]